jgi:hypothetical protein
MGLLIGKIEPAYVALTGGSAMSIEERCRRTMLRNIDAQVKKLKNGGKGPGRTWFKIAGNQIVFIPRSRMFQLRKRSARAKRMRFQSLRRP